MSAVVERLAAALADRYRIERELGAGGMATVYLAHDVKHDRKVALKVLKPELAAVIGGARFLSEIKTTANLQHPHILPLHDSGEVDGTVFYVMPFVDGETLRDRLTREKQLPIDDALRIAGEVADALHYAHGHGVIHRDIKPENILLHGGHALVADFGIALAASSTAGTRMTETGMSLGTPQYMSPEQAMGERTLDARTDVYALGCVLYEMLTGDPPFTGSTAQAVVAKVLTTEPESLGTLRRTVPPHVDQAVRAALQKLPADRPATAAQFAVLLTTPGAATTSASATARDRVIANRLSMLLGVALLLTGALAAWGWLRPRSNELPVLRYEVAERDGSEPCNFGFVNGAALSPDGRRVAYCVQEKDVSRLWLRSRDAAHAAPVAGTEQASDVVFSPDGGRLAFESQGRLRIATLNGAPPATVADTGIGNDGLSWGRDGWVYIDGVTGNGVTGLVRLRPDGTAREILTTVDTARGETDHVYPDALPNGRAVLFTIRKRTGPPVIAVLDLKAKRSTVLLAGANARFVEPGYLVYTADAKSLVGVPFDPARLTVTGSGIFLADVSPSTPQAADVAVSASGTLMYLSGGAFGFTGAPAWVELSGHATLVDSQFPASVDGLALSPDGQTLVVATTGDAFTGERLFVKPVQGGALTPLPVPGARSRMPRWSADGQSILYLSDPRNMGGIGELWRIQSNGAGRAVRMAPWDDFFAYDVKGDWIVASRTLSSQSDVVVARRVSADTVFTKLFESSTKAAIPRLTPDGRWVAFISFESGTPEWYIRPFPDAVAGKWAISTGVGAADALWSKDGKTFYYVDAAQKVIAISLEFGAAMRVKARRELFDASPYALAAPGTWDLSHDGQRFLMLKRREARDKIRTFFIENVPALLRREASRTEGKP